MPDDVVAAAADRLYALPLDQFTSARNDLAADLRRQGLRAEADAVKALRKPSAPAWALNQLAHRRRADIAELVEAGRQLRDAQERLLRGGGREALQAAVARERDLVERLAADAATIATEGGVSRTPALMERLRSTLHAAAADEQTAVELAAGHLVRERQAVGFPDLTGGAPVPSRRVAAPRQDVDRKRVHELRERLAKAESEERALLRSVRTAESNRERAQSRVDGALDRLRAAQAAEAEAHAEAEAAAAEVERLRSQLAQLEE